MRKLLVLLSLCVIATSVSAAAPYQVADLRTTPFTVPSSYPVFFANLDGVALFTTYDDNDRSGALWRSDGTEAGTQKLVQFRFGENLLLQHLRVGNTIYFAAQVGEDFQTVIFRTNGSIEGTVAVADLRHNADEIQPVGVLGDKIIFTRNTRDLWVADAHGQRLLTSMLRPHSTAQFTNSAQWNGSVYVANDGGLWKTDGTAGGTVKLPVDRAWAPTVAQDRLFFVAVAAGAGAELWTTDGSVAGTRIVSDLHPGAPASTFTYVTTTLLPFGDGVLWFGWQGDFGSSDGNTMRVLRTGAPRGLTSPRGAVIRNGIAYFGFDDGVHGRELWRTDGTDAGTAMVVDTAADATARLDALSLSGSKFYYFGSDATHAYALFENDGSGAPPRLVHGFSADRLAATNTIGVAGDKVLFRGWDAVRGYEPWVYDAAGARLLRNIAVEDPGSSNPEHLVAHAGQLYFVADDDDGPALWRTNGTASGTLPLTRDEVRSEVPLPLESLGDTLFGARAFDELLKLDPSTGEEVLLETLPLADSGRTETTVQNGRFYFLSERALWTSDGTEAGTVRISNDADSRLPVTLAGRAYFVDRRGLHETDGTRAGDRLITVTDDDGYDHTDLHAFGPSLYRSSYQAVRKFTGGATDSAKLEGLPDGVPVAATTRDAIFFFYDTYNAPMQLWKSDGTPQGTQLVRQFAINDRNPHTHLVSLGERIIFSVDDGVHGIEPWVADASGTRMLRDISSGSSDADGFYVADGIAYFAATDEQHGRELWQTDGTPEGTKLVADIFTGAASSSPEELTRVGDRLYFSARSTAGRELWAYELPRDVTVTIADARASENAGTIALTVRLNRASAQSIEVAFTTADDTAQAGEDYTATSGTLVFAPGDTMKTITVPVANDRESNHVRGFFVRLSTNDAKYERAVAGGIIEDDDVVVDLLMTLEPYKGGARVVAGNVGLSHASNVVFCSATPPARNEFACSDPFTLEAGATRTFDVPEFGSGAIVAKVTQAESDVRPNNNLSTWAVVSSPQYMVYIHPSTPRRGDQVTVMVARRSGSSSEQAAEVLLVSRNETVIAVPERMTIPAGADVALIQVPALARGFTFLGVHQPTRAYGATINVYGQSEPVKTTPLMSWDNSRGGRWGFSVQELKVMVRGITYDGAQPTGTVEFFFSQRVDGSGQPVSAGVVPVRNGIASLRVAPAVGEGAYYTVYSGDENFAPEGTEFLYVKIDRGQPQVHVERIPETNDLLITLTGVDGYAPTGTIMVEDITRTDSQRPGRLTAVDAMQSTFIATGIGNAQTIRVHYDGDANYAAGVRTIAINRTKKQRAVGK